MGEQLFQYIYCVHFSCWDNLKLGGKKTIKKEHILTKQLTKSLEPLKKLVLGQILSGLLVINPLKYILNSPELHLAREETVESFNKPVLNL